MNVDWVMNLPTLNAGLNGFASVLLVAGFLAVKLKGDEELHKRLMMGAFLVSVLFLVSYLVYHAQVGSVKFEGTGWIRTLYLTILVPHIILSALLVPLVVATIVFAIKQKFETHKKIVKWTFPVWIYVSISGVMVYLMLYHLDLNPV